MRQLELFDHAELRRLGDPLVHVLAIARARFAADPGAIGPAVHPHLVALLLADHELQNARGLPAALVAAERIADAGIAIGEAVRTTEAPIWRPPPSLRSGWSL